MLVAHLEAALTRENPMTSESTPEIENLELNKETLQELAEQEGEQVRGGLVKTGSNCVPSNHPLAC